MQVVEQGGEDGGGVEEHDGSVLRGTGFGGRILHHVDAIGVLRGERSGRLGGGHAQSGLELDGGLTLVGRLVADAQKRAGRVEQAPDRRGVRRVQVTLDHLVAQARRLPHRFDESSGGRMFEQVEGVQHAIGHAARVAHGGGTTGHGYVGKVGEALEGLLVGDHDLAAPNTPVHAVAGAVERDAAHRPEQAVLAEHRSDVGVMMLHFEQRRAG